MSAQMMVLNPVVTYLIKYAIQEAQATTYGEMLILQSEGTLPAIPHKELLQKYSGVQVSSTFFTKDDLNDPLQVEGKVAFFVEKYGMRNNKIKIVVTIAKNPTCDEGKGHLYKMKISVFPRDAYEAFT